jgi:glycosyltransferase involved in cell wall biosynthesis
VAQPIDHPWFAEGAPPVILGVGKLKPQKDFATLLRAFATLRAGRAARLVILGEGEQRGELEALAQNLGIAADVALPGFVDNPFPYMARASLFVLSSRFEGLPGVLIQALACGCPAVSTDCPSGPAEILEGGRYGPLVPVGDAEGLARAMAETLAAPLSPDILRERAAFFSTERAACNTLAVLRPAAPNPPADLRTDVIPPR